jgi:hypothetical protein
MRVETVLGVRIGYIPGFRRTGILFADSFNKRKREVIEFSGIKAISLA